jgi:hypothetical protein
VASVLLNSPKSYLVDWTDFRGARQIGPLDRLSRRNGIGQRFRAQIEPDAVVRAERAERVHQPRVEPSPTALAHHLQGSVNAAPAPVDLGDLREADDARAKGNLIVA